VAHLDDVMDPAYLEGLEGWSVDDVRARRDEALEVETGLSYLRRMVQGRLDIVLAEEERRRQGQEPADLGHLVERLPEILGDRVHAPGLGRLPALIGPGVLDAELEQRLDSLLPASRLEALDQLAPAELESVSKGLEALERNVSSQRRGVFEVLDRLQEELVRRYRTGEATVDSLLP
jgi:hypothetical protein